MSKEFEFPESLEHESEMPPGVRSIIEVMGRMDARPDSRELEWQGARLRKPEGE